MNRIIKFRIWNKTDKKLYQPHAISEDILNREDLEVMQFTGLLDKNGKEIWEGDIVRGIGWAGVQEIKYDNNRWQEGYHFSGFEYPGAEELEVIGNIYSTPQLLNK